MRFEDYVCFWGDVVVAHGADDVGGAMLRGGILVFFRCVWDLASL